MATETSIIGEVKDHVTSLLLKKLPENMTYHSISHTLDVVSSANEIGEQQGLGEEDMEILTIAAWFHDVGYVEGCEAHEESGAAIASTFLEKRGYPKNKINKVVGCIMATKMPQNPTNTIEKILCDADLLHLAKEDYFKKAELLHKEIESTKHCEISDDEWMKMNRDFLNGHCFFTDYAKGKYTSAVKENLRKVRERLKSWKKAKK